MELTYLSVKNYRSLESTEIEGFGKINTFYGENNTGKSNILSAIRFGIYGSVGRSDEIHFSSWGIGGRTTYDVFQNDPDKTAEVSVKLSFEPTDIKQMERILALEKPTKYTEGFSKDDLIGGKTVQISRTLNLTADGIQIDTTEVLLDSKTLTPIRYDTPRKSGENLTNLLAKILTGCFQEISAFRKLSHETDTPNYRISPWSWISGEDLKKALFTLSHSENAEDRRNFADICSAFSSPPFSYGNISVVRSQERDIGRISLMVEQGSFEVPIENLGSGPQQVLILLTNTLRRKGHIIAIEEPECNLSPKTQIEFVGKLTEYTTMPGSPVGQLFVSTHSSVFGYKGIVFRVEHDGTRSTVRKVESERDKKKRDEHFGPTWKNLRGLPSKE